jgi:hypothetical protein
MLIDISKIRKFMKRPFGQLELLVRRARGHYEPLYWKTQKRVFVVEIAIGDSLWHAQDGYWRFDELLALHIVYWDCEDDDVVEFRGVELVIPFFVVGLATRRRA